MNKREKAIELIESLNIDKLHQYFNDEQHLRECLCEEYDNGFISLESLELLAKD